MATKKDYKERKSEERKGIGVKRIFTKSEKAPEDYFEFTPRSGDDVIIKDLRDNHIIYDGNGTVFPKTWSDTAVRIVGSKYFFKGDENEYVEKNLNQLVPRVVDTITKKGIEQGIISGQNARTFRDELVYMAYNQSWAANSPVWFNVGLTDKYGVRETERSASHWAFDKKTGKVTNDIDAYERPQSPACFIQSIGDNMEDIMAHATREAMLFKFGSGTGTNFGNLRGVGEPLKGGGRASGQTSFMKIYDIIAGTVQSGGKTRRAAKMVIEPCDHPDLMRFIHWKVEEEKKALWLCSNPRWAPRSANDLESEAYKTPTGQNGNNTVRVTDEFMKAALAGDEWSLWFRTANRFPKEVDIPLDKYRDDRYLPDKRFIKRLTNKRKIVNAGEVLERIARAAAVTGDPAVQYDDTINKWNTVPNFGRINASNPCSEFMAPDDTACNLASVNLKKFSPQELSGGKSDKTGVDYKPVINIADFKQAVRNSIIAQEILVDYSSYPSQKIADNSIKLRPLGLGYTNLGALLMENGIAYDSDEGRAIASAVTSLMTAYAYQTSAELSSKLGPFQEFEKNKKPMLDVMKMHRDATKKIKRVLGVDGLEELVDEAEKAWDDVVAKGKKYGFRNSQVTLLAPTGTIGLMMDVDCTGIEPMPAIQYKKGLAGGGEIQMELKPCVERGLRKLGYDGERLEKILNYVKKEGSVVGAPELKEEHYKVFQTAFGDDSLSVDAHLGMMTAVQPFLSGAISKTVNLPRGSTIQNVRDTYVKGWKLGLKSVSLYIDGSKGIQPLNVQTKKEKKERNWGDRIKPENSLSNGGFIESAGWNISVNSTGVRLIVGEYDNRPPKDSPAEFFVEFGSAGSEYSAAYTSWGKEASRNRQRGETIEEFIRHNKGARGSVKGMTNHPFIKFCSSIEDAFAKIVQLEYLGDTSICDPKPTEEQLKELRCNVLGNRRRDRHYQSRIDFIERAMEKGELLEVFPLYQDELKKGEIPIFDIICNNCGGKTEISGANCRSCYNCGNSGGCGG